MRRKEELELSRRNVTPAQFLAYVRQQIKKHGLKNISACDIDLDYFRAGTDMNFNYYNDPVNHPAAKAETSISKPYEMQTYVLNWDGTVFNHIMEFTFDDDKTGYGYFYFVNIWDDTEDTEKTEESNDNEQTGKKEETKMNIYGEYFYGNKISDYGIENGFVDYGTLAKAFNAVLNNDIMEKTYDIGYWEKVSGFVDNSERIDEINGDIEELETDARNMRADAADLYDSGDIDGCNELEDRANDMIDRVDELREELEELEREQDDEPDIFQWFIVDNNGASILQEVNEIVYYNDTLDMYLWGVTHYGTAWSHVLTDIPCNTGKF